MNIASMLDLFDHMVWAEAEVWRAVLDSDRAREDEKLRALLFHVQVAQRIFLRTWRGESLDEPFPQFDQTPALCAWAAASYDEARSHIASLTESQLHEPMPAAWAQRFERLLGPACATATVRDTTMHVALHSQYHRSQINARLRELGGTPPLVDYIAWVWFGRPTPDWPTTADESAR
jgi:uncharacterized damage-inducible protein DinB